MIDAKAFLVELPNPLDSGEVVGIHHGFYGKEGAMHTVSTPHCIVLLYLIISCPLYV